MHARIVLRFLKERHFCLSNLLDISVHVNRFYIVGVCFCYVGTATVSTNRKKGEEEEGNRFTLFLGRKYSIMATPAI